MDNISQLARQTWELYQNGVMNAQELLDILQVYHDQGQVSVGDLAVIRGEIERMYEQQMRDLMGGIDHDPYIGVGRSEQDEIDEQMRLFEANDRRAEEEERKIMEDIARDEERIINNRRADRIGAVRARVRSNARSSIYSADESKEGVERGRCANDTDLMAVDIGMYDPDTVKIRSLAGIYCYRNSEIERIIDESFFIDEKAEILCLRLSYTGEIVTTESVCNCMVEWELNHRITLSLQPLQVQNKLIVKHQQDRIYELVVDLNN